MLENMVDDDEIDLLVRGQKCLHRGMGLAANEVGTELAESSSWLHCDSPQGGLLALAFF